MYFSTKGLPVLVCSGTQLRATTTSKAENLDIETDCTPAQLATGSIFVLAHA